MHNFIPIVPPIVQIPCRQVPAPPPNQKLSHVREHMRKAPPPGQGARENPITDPWARTILPLSTRPSCLNFPGFRKFQALKLVRKTNSPSPSLGGGSAQSSVTPPAPGKRTKQWRTNRVKASQQRIQIISLAKTWEFAWPVRLSGRNLPGKGSLWAGQCLPEREREKYRVRGFWDW